MLPLLYADLILETLSTEKIFYSIIGDNPTRTNGVAGVTVAQYCIGTALLHPAIACRNVVAFMEIYIHMAEYEVDCSAKPNATVY